jgi:hypothetical protein
MFSAALPSPLATRSTFNGATHDLRILSRNDLNAGQ